MADVIQDKIYKAYAIAAIEKLASDGNSSPSEEEIVKTAAVLLDTEDNSAADFRKVAYLDEIGRNLAKLYIENPTNLPKLASVQQAIGTVLKRTKAGLKQETNILKNTFGYNRGKGLSKSKAGLATAKQYGENVPIETLAVAAGGAAVGTVGAASHLLRD